MTDPLWDDMRDSEKALDTTVSLLRTGGVDDETVAAVLLCKAAEVWRKAGYSEEAIKNMLLDAVYVPVADLGGDRP